MYKLAYLFIRRRYIESAEHVLICKETRHEITLSIIQHVPEANTYRHSVLSEQRLQCRTLP
jgi:hypothetical protein